MNYTIEPKNRFVEAMRTLPEFEIRPGNTVTFVSEVDLTAVEAIRATAKERPSYTAFVMKALALAMREFPYANRRLCRRWWWPLSVRLQRFEHCDIAVNVERNVPGAESATFADVCRDVDRRTLADLTAWLRALATCDETNNLQWRAFSGVVRKAPSWLSRWLIRVPLFSPSLWVKYRGAAALVSSPAKYGVDTMLGSWPSPLGISFGLAKPRPVVCDGQVVARMTFALSLNFDRRVMAGAQAAKFFRRIVELLEAGELV